MESWKGKLILLAGSVLVSLLVIEVGLAMFHPQATIRVLKKDSPGIYVPSEILPFGIRPNMDVRLARKEFDVSVRIGSLGHRGKDFTREKPDGTFRVLAVGDSFTFGWGVEDNETYPARLDDGLQERHPSLPIEIINAGFVGCLYPDTYYLYLREIGLKFDPDLVVIGFFIGNDIDHALSGEFEWTSVGENGLPDRIEAPGFAIENGHRVPKDVRRRYRYPVLRNSHLVQLMARSIRRQRAKPGPHFNHWMYRAEYSERTVRSIEVVQTMFQAIAELTRKRDIPLLVVMIPAREQLYPGEYPLDEYPFMEDYDLGKPQRIFADFFSTRGIEYLDLLPLLEPYRDTTALYFVEDAHWTREGNEIASREVARLISDTWIRTESSAPWEPGSTESALDSPPVTLIDGPGA